MKKIVCTLLISSLFLLVNAQGTYEINEKGNALLKAIDKRMSPESYESYRKLINIEPSGSKKEFVMWTAKKGIDKMVTTFLSPKSEIGRSTLRDGESIWLYVPSVGKPVRITSLQSIVGGVFNNSDIMQLEYSVEYDCVAYEEKGDEIILTLKAKNNNVAYDRLLMTVDKKAQYPIEIKCQTAGEMLIKTLHFKEPKKYADGIVRTTVTETDSPLNKGYKSVMITSEMKKREFKDEVFTLNFMSKITSLRQ